MTPLVVPLALALIVVTLGYWLRCLAAPFARCPWCREGNRDLCIACHGTGLRARLGWRALGALRRLNRDTDTWKENR